MLGRLAACGKCTKEGERQWYECRSRTNGKAGHVQTIAAVTGTRIERIGSERADLPGIRRLEWHERPSPDGRFPRLPLPDVVLTFNLGVRGRYRVHSAQMWHPYPRTALRGICSMPSEGVDPDSGWIGYVSVLIAPWAVPCYFSMDASGLADRIANAELRLPALGTLFTGLAIDHVADERLRRVDEWLIARFRATSQSLPAQQVVELLRSGTSIHETARCMSLSVRRIHQVCRATTGQSPRTYAQVARFAKLAESLNASIVDDHWAHFVGDYADHSHAIRQFRRHAGLTPREYQQRQGTTRRAFSMVADWNGEASTA